jgi:hypothetical protein
MIDEHSMPKFKFTFDAFTELELENKRRELRDKFALQAMTILPCPSDYIGKDETDESYAAFAEKAYRIANAMMKHRTIGD